MKLILSTLVFFLASVSVFSQKAISKEEFEQAYNSAVEKGEQESRVHRSKLTAFQNGVEVSSTWEWEYEGPYRHRMRFERVSAEGTDRLERISLEEKTFCRSNDGSWRIEAGSCAGNLPWMITQRSYMLRQNAEPRFSSELTEVEGAKAMMFRESGVFTVTPLGRERIRSFYKSSFWVDSVGRILKQEYRSGRVDVGKVSTTWNDSFVYRGNIRIEAPIK